MSVLLRGGRLGLGGAASDVRIDDGTVTAVGPAGSLDATEVVSLGDATVLPGLVDGHVHVEQWVRHRRSVDLSAATGPAEAARALRATAPAPGQWLSGRDIVPALWDTPAHKRFLDGELGDVPVVVRSIDLHTTWFNSAALALVGLPDHPTGVLRETESIEANHRLSELTPAAEVDGWIAEALAELPSLGLTGLIDLEFSDNLAAWPRRVAAHGAPPVRVHAGIWTPWLDAAIAAGRRTGEVVEGTSGRVRVGPYKIVSDGSLNTRTAWCADPYPDDSHGLCLVPADELEALMSRAWAAGLVPAIHAIGDRANTAVLDVFARIGCTGRIEHAQLVALDDVPRFAELGVVASVQPQHAVTDRDVADRLWAGRTDRAFAYRTLHDAGARLELGSDAPVSPLDPWQAIADAVHRSDDGRPAWHPEQALPLDVAITAACAGRASVEVGAVADLTVVAGDPSAASEESLRGTIVLATLVGGDFTYRR
ncbi:amidohydrolase [Cryptosporangium arvum]|uniref:Putative TIM-barrel fold metal-dependent hydrolase n=1 Tax=Cryptosporangium arvum DSM 44712 TaxID=927661 RepID=A0A011A061_9ACTN|nr:amidohydrolase [Cryptosporangium arvum]EXG82867.1 putative TIM-barrel fold metal-dependent hydrolase [Cryptosporangium arvum DSM 44712]